MARKTLEGELSSATRELLNSCKQRGLLFFYRVTSEGITRGGKRIKIPDRGISDYLLMIKGQTHYLELKTLVGKQTASQKEFERNVTMHGCPYHICRSIREVQALVARLII